MTIHQPSIITAVPGPVSTDGLKALDSVFDARAAQLVLDYEKSSGNL